MGTPVTSWPSSVNRTPQGKFVGLPQQHPAEKHPCRPSTFPSAIPGAQASAVFHQGNFHGPIRKYPVMVAPAARRKRLLQIAKNPAKRVAADARDTQAR